MTCEHLANRSFKAIAKYIYIVRVALIEKIIIKKAQVSVNQTNSLYNLVKVIKFMGHDEGN